MSVGTIARATDVACELSEVWLHTLPPWAKHPVTEDGGASGNRGPTLLSEADCVLHFARFLRDAGIAWEDMHFELSRATTLFAKTHPTFVQAHNWRVDLAVVSREALLGSSPPFADDSFRFEAFYEFALASAFWLHGKPWGHPAKLREKVAGDAQKVSRYVQLGLCRDAYVVVFEECDHGFPAAPASEPIPHVHVRILRGWDETSAAGQSE